VNIIKKFYLKFFVNSGFPYAQYLKKTNVFHKQGENCFISKNAEIPDPYLVCMGDNVWITAGSTLLGHDASVVMINVMEEGHLDSVGPIVIGDNCFIGNNTLILPNISIGSNTIIGAGSVVTKDVPDNSVWAGNPARLISSFEEYTAKAEERTKQYPWNSLLKNQPVHIYDPELETRLKQMRTQYFFERKVGVSHD
jgi:acetyltransferase-like isoleucine patch superfamily enzyme